MEKSSARFSLNYANFFFLGICFLGKASVCRFHLASLFFSPVTSEAGFFMSLLRSDATNSIAIILKL